MNQTYHLDLIISKILQKKKKKAQMIPFWSLTPQK